MHTHLPKTKCPGCNQPYLTGNYCYRCGWKPGMKRKYGSGYAGASSSTAARRPYKAPRQIQRGTLVAIPRPLAAPIRFQQRHIGGEVKSVDTIAPNNGATQGNFSLNTTIQITALNLVTAGSSMWNRIGRKLSMKSVHVRFALTPTGNNAANTGLYSRVIVIYDKQPNGALPNASDVLQDQTNGATDQHVTLVTSGINLNNRDRFEVLVDDCRYLPGGNTSTDAANVVTATVDQCHWDIFRKLKGRETHFKADSAPAVIGDLSTGSLILLTMGSIASGAEPYGLYGSVRLRYTDL